MLLKEKNNLDTMIEVRADFHIHSKYSPGVAKNIDLNELSKFAKLKGLNLIGTGDALLPTWRKTLEENLKYDNEIYEYNGIYFVPSVEIKLNVHLHSVVLLPTLDDFEYLYNILSKNNKLDKTGTPTIRYDPSELLDIIEEIDGLLIPAHIFVPWQSLYARFNSLKEAFRENYRKIYAVELGLSADPPLAEKVPELRDLSYLSNSDPHSLWDLGREFNILEIEEIKYPDIKKAITRGDIINFEEPPALGKYYLTRCRGCKTFFKYETAKRYGFRCPVCKDRIYLGVYDRIINELSRGSKDSKDTYEVVKTKEHKFKYTLTLQKILQYFLNYSKEESRKLSLKVVEKTKLSEIDIIHFSDLTQLKIPEILKKTILKFRGGEYYVYPGGGGEFGKISSEKVDVQFYVDEQKRLDQYFKR